MLIWNTAMWWWVAGAALLVLALVIAAAILSLILYTAKKSHERWDNEQGKSSIDS